jgi:hypothetical protein
MMYFTESQIQIIVILILFMLFTTGIGSYKLGCNITTEKYKSRGTTTKSYSNSHNDFDKMRGTKR